MGVRKLCAFLGAFFFFIIIIIIVLLLSLYGCAEVVWCLLVTSHDSNLLKYGLDRFKHVGRSKLGS